MADSVKETQNEKPQLDSTGEADLRSVLVTSVLNLDRLDTDLYR